MRKISADFILPVSSPPIKQGVVVIDQRGKIISIGERNDFEISELEIYHGIICPGFINAHCHLELSYMKGKFPEHAGLVNFLTQILTTRNDEEEGVQQAIIAADLEMNEAGIVGVGDISNRITSFFQKEKSALRYHTFVESNGVNPAEAETFFQRAKYVLDEALARKMPASLTPHAPYSISNELFEKIFLVRENNPALFSYHNQESEEENKLYRGEPNAFDKIYELLNVPSTRHRTGASALLAHINYFPKDVKTLFVHNTATSKEDVVFAMQSHPNLFWCLCPNANLYIENELPKFQNFILYDDGICLGTDSYASNHQLSILEEMKAIQFADKTISTSQLLKWATINGAVFFGWENELGSIEIGKRPGLNLISNTQENFRLSTSSIVKKLL